MLILQGDIWDKGGADLYVLRQLLSLHRRYPDRVHFLMGNRDINKMRIVDELGIFRSSNGHEASMIGDEALFDDMALPYHGGVYWLRGTGLRGDPTHQYYDTVGDVNARDIYDGENSHHGSDHDNQYPPQKNNSASKRRSIVPSKNAVERLKWMLRKTMGSVDAFELRRCELERERLAIMNSTSAFTSRYSGSVEFEKNGENFEESNSPSTKIELKNISMSVTDDEVTQSYIRSCSSVSGIMSQYLTRAKLMIRIGPVLFLHGALPFTPNNALLGKADNDAQSLALTSEKSYDFPTPWICPNTKNVYHSLAEWLDDLNSFASSQVEAWKEFGCSLQNKHHVPQDGVWATEGGYFNNTPAGKMFGPLLQYGMGTLPDRSKNPSVVYNSWMWNGMPRDDMFGSSGYSLDGQRADKISQWKDFMHQEGVQVIVTGHQPVGDMPWPIQISHGKEPLDNHVLLSRKEKLNRWILACDTSFSGDTCWAMIEGSDSDERGNLGRGSGSNGRGEVSFW